MNYQLIFKLEDKEKKLELITNWKQIHKLAIKYLKKYNLDKVIINRRKNGEWQFFLTISYLEWKRKQFEANLE